MFPLGSVLLPHALLPLHVFEPRYRAMMHDIIDDAREFGVVLIEAGRELGGGDRRSDIGTLARIVQAEEFEDGRWGLVAVGTQRLRVVEWLPDDPYPRAAVVELPDAPAAADATQLRAQVVTTLRRVLALATELGAAVPDATSELAEDPLVASYHVATLAPFGPHDRQRLLAEPDASDRLRLARALLDELSDELLLRLAASDREDEP